MSLERVIDEQQKEIDALRKQIEVWARDLETAFTRHDKLFELIGRYMDHPDSNDLRHEVRLGLMDAGFHMCCYSFDCMCEEE